MTYLSPKAHQHAEGRAEQQQRVNTACASMTKLTRTVYRRLNPVTGRMEEVR